MFHFSELYEEMPFPTTALWQKSALAHIYWRISLQIFTIRLCRPVSFG